MWFKRKERPIIDMFVSYVWFRKNEERLILCLGLGVVNVKKNRRDTN